MRLLSAAVTTTLAWVLCCTPPVGGLRPGAPARDAPSAVVRDGPVVGDWVEDVSPRVARFRGIPFAASTAGVNRWAPPVPPEAWGPAPLDATSFGFACVQVPSPGDPDVPSVQSEDCLNLNVYTPVLGRAPGRDLVPVMLWFHGGAFVSGSNAGPWGLYEGSRVASRGGVVVVSANYRLDALGWLVTSAANGARGNFGLLDQRAAMRWVVDNVAAFGGDPSRVTLWGESAGAMSSLVHMSSPPSTGLFQRVIMQSNPAGFSYTTAAYMAVYGDALASQAGCGKPPKGTTQLDCLRNVSATQIMVASAAVVSSYYDVARGSGYSVLDGVLQWGPVLDEEQLPTQPMALVAARALLAPVDVLVGHNTDEVATFIDASYYAREYPTLVYETVLYSVFGLLGASAVKAQYARYGLPSLDTLDLIMTDCWFKCAKEAIAAAAAAAGAHAWSYRYAHNMSFGPSVWDPLGLPQCISKVCHTAELALVFGNAGEWAFSAEEEALSHALIDAWTNFAHTGDPNTRPRGAHWRDRAVAVATARRALRHAPVAQWRTGEDASALRVEPPAWPRFNNRTRLSVVLDTVVDQESSLDICPFWDGIGYSRK